MAVEKLLPDINFKTIDGQIAETPGFNGFPGYIIGKKGDSHILFYKAADKVSVAGFQYRADGEGHGCQFFIHKPSVAHAFFRKEKGKGYQFPYGDGSFG